MRNTRRINRFTCFFFTLETNQDTFFCDLTNYPRYLFWYATASRNSDYDRMLHIWFWVANRNNRLFWKNIYHTNLVLTGCQINPWTYNYPLIINNQVKHVKWKIFYLQLFCHIFLMSLFPLFLLGAIFSLRWQSFAHYWPPIH